MSFLEQGKNGRGEDGVEIEHRIFVWVANVFL